MTPEAASVSYGIACAVAWGAADFNGGLASRKGALMGVVISCQVIGGMFLLVAALVSSEPLPPLPHLLYGGMAGVFGVSGLFALYRGLALGRMGIVAPLSAVLTALVPMGYTMLQLGLPSAVRLAGFVFFALAVWLLSSGGTAFKLTPGELFLSIFAGLGFGLFFICIDKSNDIAVFWPLVSARFTAVCLVLVIIFINGRPSFPAPGQWIFVIVSGVLDACGNCLFSMAAQSGRLDIAAVTSSLYPAATVLLAFVFLKERLRPLQWAGVAATFVSLVLISV